eukprot:TRINITY_DN11169_c0_g2_i1.p1 TRINITY_DN11169_c0_g2~~TRINITY_DN11169_c0_g2_i1.p1  ORF type:complete len:687 (+),score=159.03 TRINITY_DN11169_c0_g2_i1:28-2061(+)
MEQPVFDDADGEEFDEIQVVEVTDHEDDQDDGQDDNHDGDDFVVHVGEFAELAETDLLSHISELQREIKRNKKAMNKLQKRNDRMKEQIEALKSRQVEAMMTKGIHESRSESFRNEPLEKATKVLREVFRLRDWRSPQKEIINAVLSGKDVLVIMPAGSGKSLTYQLPAVVQEQGRVVFVISPLLALMVDQVEQMKKIGVASVMISSATSREDNNKVWKTLSEEQSTDIRLIYVTPEFLARSKTLRINISKLHLAGRIALFVIDEAHCCSQWGHDFRPDYRKLNLLRALWKDVPIMALTATAPHSVRKDIVTLLQMKDPILFFKPVKRNNLFYSVVEKKTPTETTIMIGQMIQQRHPNECGLVYCLQKRDTEDLANVLQSTFGIPSVSFHADLKPQERDTRYRMWCAGKVKVIVATVAFGMGIHKADVRFVYHHTMSKSLSAYYQESGRAGRDGQPSQCILFYSPYDAGRIAALSCGDANGMIHLRSMLKYAQAKKECRNKIISEHFEESLWIVNDDGTKMQVNSCATGCDNCASRGDESPNMVDLTSACSAVLENMKKPSALTRKTMIQLEKDLPTVDVLFKPLSRHQRGEIMVEMFLQKAVGFEFVENAYTINSYLTPLEKKLSSPILVEVKQKKKPSRKRKVESEEDVEEVVGGEDVIEDSDPVKRRRRSNSSQ